MFLIMRENDFNQLSDEVIQMFSHIEKREANEWETHKNDEHYLKLKKAEKKAKKDLQTYLFNKRHK
jgi:hypothetical protein